MLKFISFGSGSSGNCYYLFNEHEGLIIDIGLGLRTLKKYFQMYGLSLHNIRNVLVTHDHADHVKSVGSFSRDFLMPVHATERVHAGIANNYCVRHKLTADMKKIITPGQQFQLDGFMITPFSVPHDSQENVGYFIEYGDINFCLITDVGQVTEEIAGYISRAQYLVLESNYELEYLMHGPYPEHLKKRIISGRGHLSNQQCGQALAQYATPELKHVWLCHLSQENNHPELARKTVERELRSVGIIPGKDFLLDVLKRTTPSNIIELV